MKIKKLFSVVVISIVFVLYAVWKISWWYEDIKLEEQRLEELISYTKEPSLRGLKILDFHGTHKGREWQGGGVARFIFYSKHGLEFPYMKKVYAKPYNERRNYYLVKNIIEKRIGKDVGDLRGEQVYYELIDKEHQIKVFVNEFDSGFYIRAEMIEL